MSATFLRRTASFGGGEVIVRLGEGLRASPVAPPIGRTDRRPNERYGGRPDEMPAMGSTPP